MTRTTQDLKVEICRLNRLIARIELKPNGEWTAWSSTLHDLVEERELLGLVVLNRAHRGQQARGELPPLARRSLGA